MGRIKGQKHSKDSLVVRQLKQTFKQLATQLAASKVKSLKLEKELLLTKSMLDRAMKGSKNDIEG